MEEVFASKPAKSPSDIYAGKPKKGEPWDVVIVGSGPAGLTSAIYTTRGAASTAILGGEKWGGQLMLTTEVDNFPGFPKGIQGPELMMKMREQVERFGAEFVQKNVDSVDFSKNPFEFNVGEIKYLARSVIIATGALTRWLGVPREKELIGRGVSSCAPCDAPFYKGKEIVVIGGGDSAMEEALVLTKYATSVTIIHRRDEFRASKAMQQKIFAAKVSVIWDTEVVEMMGEEKLTGLKLKTKLASRQAEGDKINQYKGKIIEEKDSWLVWEKPTEGAFVAIGYKPDTDIFKGPIETDEKGYIVVHDHTETNVPGVFVAGDVHDFRYKQAVTAAGFGCMAGMDALKYLEEIKEKPSKA